MRKEIGLLMMLFLIVVTVAACGDLEVHQIGAGNEQDDVTTMTSRNNELANVPEVMDEDLADMPEDALVIPLSELHEHELFSLLYEEDGQWTLCHLTGDCTTGIMPLSGHNEMTILGDVLHFRTGVDRVFMPLIGTEVAECRTNDRNNLLICEGANFDAGVASEKLGNEGMIAVSDADDLMQEMTVRLTDETIFEIVQTDGFNSTSSQGSRRDLEELVGGTSTSYSLSIRHEEMDGEFVATLIQIIKLPW